ncbi:hypothetical protein OK016_21815 [Vibrio chagasii]|nr:hypothetical protein [Vibrio chagasii]
MDCMMPVMDGATGHTGRIEKETTKSTRRIPIIALTASVIDDDIQKCFLMWVWTRFTRPSRSNSRC